MRNTFLASLTLGALLLAGCGHVPGAASFAARTAPQAVAAQATSGLIVSDVQDFSGAASSVIGQTAEGEFVLSLVWVAVPHTFISRLDWVRLNGAPLGDITAVQAQLRAAAKNPANARFAKALLNVALELNEKKK